MISLYRVILALHIVSIVAWMAGVLYLFRLFVYHAEETEAVVKERFKIMEMRLYRYITVPAMVAAAVFGFSMLALQPGFLTAPWLHAKLLFVLVLIGMTLYGGSQIAVFKTGAGHLRSRTYRILNEIPTLLLILIVFLVVLKPF